MASIEYISNPRAIEMFWANVVVAPDDGYCWGWNGETNKRDTPLIRFHENSKRKEFYPRQISLMLHNKPLSKRVELTCGNKLCLNPLHLVSGNEARFWSKVKKLPEAEGGCWVWTGGNRKDDYGAFSVFENGRNKQIIASRYSWELHTGQRPPTDLFVCHICDNPPCVNPNHLFLGTTQDNTADRDQKGRGAHPKGELNANALVTEEDVRRIRELYASGIPPRQINKMYESVIGPTGVRLIIDRKTWKHIA